MAQIKALERAREVASEQNLRLQHILLLKSLLRLFRAHRVHRKVRLAIQTASLVNRRGRSSGVAMVKKSIMLSSLCSLKLFQTRQLRDSDGSRTYTHGQTTKALPSKCRH